jgi:NADH-quinone oxidoreductase subunit G
VPVVGQDDTYPKDRHGNPVQPVRFTIRAEKCPNRKGVEAVLRHFTGGVTPFTEAVNWATGGTVKALYLAAGYPPRPGSGNGAPTGIKAPGGVTPSLGGAPALTSPAAKTPRLNTWLSEEQASAFNNVPLIVCHDLLPSPISAVAHYVLPGASWAEKEGTFVNHAGLAQGLRWAVIPTGETRSDGQVFLDLLERRGLVHAPALRKELALEIAYFAPLAGGNPGEYGIHLEAGGKP